MVSHRLGLTLFLLLLATVVILPRLNLKPGRQEVSPAATTKISGIADPMPTETLTSLQTLQALANDLEAGNMEQAAKRFRAPETQKRVLSWSTERRNQVIQDLRQAKLIAHRTDDVDVYGIPQPNREDRGWKAIWFLEKIGGQWRIFGQS